jgi:hypothetical protein
MPLTYLLLTLAIVSEVSGTLALRGSDGFSKLGSSIAVGAGSGPGLVQAASLSSRSASSRNARAAARCAPTEAGHGAQYGTRAASASA